MDPKSLIGRYLIGEITEAEAQELDGLPASDVELRRKFVVAAAIDTGLREVAFQRAPRQRRIRSWFSPGAFGCPTLPRPKVLATFAA